MVMEIEFEERANLTHESLTLMDEEMKDFDPADPDELLDDDLESVEE